ncbi:AIPR family protein [Fructobacillus durionis]|uniref:AIPR protein n=1 Tax=Fructobacillus durionis TaxID=283737 RepID=A0A1I1EHM2_9LACO|nr:AIPR family protein [Fructobacillus durionis]SFB84453.1 AIPR protein [Fructobacillus durionis]
MIEKFPVKSIRTTKSPSTEGVTTYTMLVDFNDLPNDISLEVNPRKPKMNTAVAKKLIHAVTGTEEDFDIKNRGIVIIANNLIFNNGQVTLDLGDDRTRFGILDGGHTYTAITQNRGDMPEDMHKYVKLEILVGENLDATGLADARNTSVQVSDIALFELDDKFNDVKDVLKKESYADDVAYKDNDNKSIPVADLLRLMYAMNIEKFASETTAPVSAYSSKAAVFRDYKKEIDKGDDNVYAKLIPLLPELVRIFEFIQRDMKKYYAEFKKANGQSSSAFGKVRGVEGAGNYHTAFSKMDIEYQISNGFIFPIFGAFRALLKENNDGTIEFEFSPEKVWNKVGVNLVQNTFETDTNPQMAGKNKTLWQGNYRIVEGAKKDLLIEKLMNQNGL